MIDDRRVRQQVQAHPYPLLFATISGAHLYGFASPDSDVDLRGVHLLPVREVVGLQQGPETIDKTGLVDGLEIDLVTHDLAKFLRLMLRRNGYVLEQLLSPFVVHTTPEHAELVALAPGCVTRHHAHHYLGFAQTQWDLFRKEPTPRVKPLLYLYRVLLTGIHLMRTGIVEANLRTLLLHEALPQVPELIERKVNGMEKGALGESDLDFHEREQERLRALLQAEHERSHLPEVPSAADALHDFLVRVRLTSVRAALSVGSLLGGGQFDLPEPAK